MKLITKTHNCDYCGELYDPTIELNFNPNIGQYCNKCANELDKPEDWQQDC